MKNLIQILPALIGSENINSVNSRDLYSSLELGKGQYLRWINKNLVDNDFFYENKDYIRVRQDVEGNQVESFVVSLDVAKHLSMMSKTSKAHEFRNYFIEVEKESKQPKTELELIIQSAQHMQQIQQKQIIQDEKLLIVEDKIDFLENKSPVSYNQLKALEDKRKSKTRELVGYDTSNAVSVENYSKTIRILTKKFKDRFCIARYADLPKDNFSDAMSWLNDISLVDLI